MAASDRRAWSVLGKAIATGGMTKDQFIIAPWGSALPKGHPIVPLSFRAFRDLTGEVWHPKKRGYVYWNEDYQAKVVPTFPPEMIVGKKMGLLQALLYDIKLSVNKPLPTIPYSQLTLYPTVAELVAWASVPTSFMVVDIETPYSAGKAEDEELEDDPSSQIIRVSLGADDGRAITFPFQAGYRDALGAILATTVDKVFWNADYDVPRLELNECKINGTIVDAMWLFHFLYPDLPRSLASAASFYTTLGEWKSLSSSSPELYSALDSHATELTYLGIRAHLQQFNMWTTAWDHVVRLQAVLRKMRLRGLDVASHEDPTTPGSLELFKVYLADQMAATLLKLNSKVPDVVKPTEVVKAKHLRGRCSCVAPAVSKAGRILKRLVPKPDCAHCIGSGWNPEIVKILDFNPDSSEQVKDLMRHHGHKIPTRKLGPGEDKETTEKKFLQIYAGKYPDVGYNDIIAFKKFSKMKSTYTEWPMRRVSATRCRVNTKITLLPATGRLASQNPNMQNIPKEGDLAERFKRCLVARPGHRLVKRDYSSIEGVLTAYFTGNPDAMKRALAGIHTYNTAKFLNIPFDEHQPLDALRATLSKLKKDHNLDVAKPGSDCSIYQRFKKADHMINYGAKAKKLFNESPGVFKDLKEAKMIHKFIYNLDPALATWHRSIENEVFGPKDAYTKKAGYRVVTPYFYNRWFWDRADLPKAIAMKPQSTAAAIIKEAMLLIDVISAGEFMVLQVHDELVFDYPDGCDCHPDARPWQEYDESVRVIMERPLAPLGGLIIRTDMTHGLDYTCH